ncbi:DUF6164 family protein [Marinicellulosiphila megalodicopiae]|uniref:DUF6164 family protein n=1 Tax=Marinicellulosiphila megalodicopiae TaxID=2724896 RepID=UPI003BAEFFEA
MAKLIFKTQSVPDDECMAIRRLLVDNDIVFHETSSGLLGLSVAGLWVDQELVDQARAIIETEQCTRQMQMRETFSRSPVTFKEQFKRHPIKWIASVLAVPAILSLIIIPFFYFSP